MDFLSGKKTYILVVAAVLYAITGYFLGNFDANTAMQMIWAALTAAGLRAGISKGKGK